MRYISRATPFHNLDPRTKILMSLACACLIVILNTPISLFCLFVVLLLAFFSIKPPFSVVKTTLYLMAIAMVATMISQGFFYYFQPRTPLVTIIPEDAGLFGRLTGGISVYREGLIYGAVQSMRFFSATLLSMIIVMSTYPSDLILGLKKLGVPEKIGFMLTVSIRFLPVLAEEAKRILVAQRLRGLRIKGLRGSIRGFRFLIEPLIIDSLRKARRIALAAEVRGYTGKRTEIKKLHFFWMDWVALSIISLAIALAVKNRFMYE